MTDQPLTPHINPLHAADYSRQQITNSTNVVKILKIVEFHYQIWIHHEKCIQISTNMPGFGSVIHEIVFEICTL